MKARKAWGLWLAAAMAGCGGEDKADATRAASVDPHDDAAWSAWLASNEIEAAPVEAEEPHRGAARLDDEVFPMFPRGDVRGAGVQRYRVDTLGDYVDGGTLEFRKGKHALWTASGAFDPKNMATVSAVPAAVTATLREGDVVTWGVYGVGRKGRDVEATFKVVEKPALERALARFEGDEHVKAQSATVRSLGRAQLLVNHGLHSEALAIYLDVVAQDPSITEAWRRIVDALRRLGLRRTPLFEDAVARMTPRKGGGGIASGPGLASGSNGSSPFPRKPTIGAEPPANGGLPLAPTDASAPAATPPTGGVPASGGTAGGLDPRAALLRDAVLARRLSDEAKARADRAQAVADRAKAAFDSATAAVDGKRKALAEAVQALESAPAGDPSRVALQDAVKAAQKALSEAQAEVDRAAAEAAAAKAGADQARLVADDLARHASEIERAAGVPPAVGGKEPLPPTQPAPVDLGAVARELRLAADHARVEANRLRGVADAAKKALADYLAGGGSDPAQVAARKEAARRADLDAADADRAAKDADQAALDAQRAAAAAGG